MEEIGVIDNSRKSSCRDIFENDNGSGRLVGDVNSGLADLSRDQLLKLVRFSNSIMSQSLPVKCILMTLRALRSNLHAELVEICLCDRESGDLVVNYMTRDGILHKKEFSPNGGGAFAHVLKTGQLLRIDDVATDLVFSKNEDQHTDIEIKSLVLCPLLDSKNNVWGVAAVINSSMQNPHILVNTASDATDASQELQSQPAEVPHNGHSEANEHWMTFLLQMCEIGGQCISNAIVWRELDATREKADGLLTLMHSLFSDRLGIQSCVVALTTHAKKLIQAERCTVLLVDRVHEQLWSISSDDGSQIVVPLTNGLLGQCVEQGQVIVIENAFEDERFDHKMNARSGVEIRNVAWVPIKSEDNNRVLAVIEVINKQAEELLHFGEDDLRLLEMFSAIVGPQLEKSDFAAAGSKHPETEAGLAFKNVPVNPSSSSRQRIPEPCIPENEEE